MKNIGITSLWEDLDDKLLTSGQLQGYPWKLCGMTVQTSYVEGQWHQNWVCSRPTKKSSVQQRKFVKNWFFLLFGLQLENEERYRDGSNGWNDAYINGQQMPCWQKVAAGPFWPCFACPKLGDAGRTRVASKNRVRFRSWKSAFFGTFFSTFYSAFTKNSAF